MKLIRLAGIASAALMLSACCGQQIPLVYDVENSGAHYAKPALPEMGELKACESLPDPLEWSDGSGKVEKFKDWERRRSEILAEIQHYETGVKPATPKECVSARLQGDTLLQVCVRIGGDSLNINAPVRIPEGEGPFPAIIGLGFGARPGSLPPDIFSRRNIAVVSFPFWEVMNHTQTRGKEPVNRILPEYEENGAYTMWPWGVSRLIDALELVSDQMRIDTRHLAITGCSFAGKMALFAGAFDERIALTIAQEPGGGGAAAWRVSETLGHVETIERTNYAWFKESMKNFELENVKYLPMDHHELCALVAPRALLVLGNPDYPWLADEAGYVSCVAARRVWENFGIADRMGYSFQAGHMHCMLPEEQKPQVEAFVDKFLLGKDVPTEVTYAPMFGEVDLERWIKW